eukprot:39607-Chlamydomonas_euryale.AAC.3
MPLTAPCRRKTQHCKTAIPCPAAAWVYLAAQFVAVVLAACFAVLWHGAGPYYSGESNFRLPIACHTCEPPMCCPVRRPRPLAPVRAPSQGRPSVAACMPSNSLANTAEACRNMHACTPSCMRIDAENSSEIGHGLLPEDVPEGGGARGHTGAFAPTGRV